MKKLFGEKGAESDLQKLDRHIRDMARATAAEILKVVNDLVPDLSAQTHCTCLPLAVEYPSFQVAWHPVTVSWKLVVRFIGDNKLVPCLTEH
jgi:hypothetical protein